MKQSSVLIIKQQLGSKMANGKICISADTFYALMEQAILLHEIEVELAMQTGRYFERNGDNTPSDIYYKNTYEKTR